MSYLLLVLYYYFDTYECFVYLANLVVCSKFLRDMYTFEMGRVTAYSKLFEQLLQQAAPDLMRYFDAQGINTMTFSIDWFYTLFSRAFDVHIVRVVWDMFFLFGTQFIVKAGVAMMVILKDEMMTQYMSEGFNFVRVRTGKLKVSTILEKALSGKYDPKEFETSIEKLYTPPPPPRKPIVAPMSSPASPMRSLK